MTVLTYPLTTGEANSPRDLRLELIERIGRMVPQDGTAEPLPGLQLRRESSTTEVGHTLAIPAFCVVALGSKEILVGDRRYRFDPAHYLIATAALPIGSRITEASPEKPYLRLRLDLDPALVGSVMVEAGHLGARTSSDVEAIDVSLLDADLLDAAVRLVRLAESPGNARYLAPLVTREIVYRLLIGEQGGRLQHIAMLGGLTHRIAEAIARLRKDFDQPLRIEILAREFGMSVSSFHHRFKAVTAVSPLEFQKQLRLQEARRLLLSEDHDATTAGLRVGYTSSSQFTREYKRLFGAPPMRDVARLRDAVAAPSDL